MASLKKGERAAFLLTLTLTFASCGSLVDQEYRGQLRLQLAGGVAGDPAPLVGHKARLALFYFPDGPQALNVALEDEATSIELAPPQSVVWPIYDEPQPRHFTTQGYAFGVPRAYLDDDGDGRKGPDEPFVGEAPIIAVMSVPSGLDATQSPTGRPLEAGFFELVRPMWCAPRPAEPASSGTDCGVPLGAACQSDAACGAGVCLLNDPWPWPNGVCALPTASACVPENAHPWRNHRDPSRSYWLPACSTDADCRQPFRCDPGNSVCLPFSNLGVRLATPLLPNCQR